jgi:hypothetical protein
MTEAVLLDCIKNGDPKCAHKLFLAITQLPETLKLDGDLQNQVVLCRMADKMRVYYGYRMLHCHNFVHASHMCYTDVGPYSCNFSENKLKTIHFRPNGDIVNIDHSNVVITDAWALVNAHSDLLAAYEFGEDNDKKLCTFFKKDPPAGPWRLVHYKGSKEKNFIESLNVVVGEYTADLQATSASTQYGSEGLKQKLKAIKLQNMAPTLIACKAAGQKALANKKLQRVAKSAPPKAKAQSVPSAAGEPTE